MDISSYSSTTTMLRISNIRSTLQSFASSPSTFKIIHSLPSSPTPKPVSSLYILDSSFNPPTLAHLHIATHALLHDPIQSTSPKRLLLLLATQNADKAPKPAAFEQRIVMMGIFAEAVLKRMKDAARTEGSKEGELASQWKDFGIDIGVTKLPYFVDKAASITESGEYCSLDIDQENSENTESSEEEVGKGRKGIQQIHLTGYDTLIRILDSKYYPPTHTLSCLTPFFQKNRLLVTYRPNSSWGSHQEQDDFVQRIADGSLDQVEGKRNWVSERRIVLVQGRKIGEGEEVVSSTRVREAVKKEERQVLGKLVPEGVGEWILEEGLYGDD